MWNAMPLILGIVAVVSLDVVWEVRGSGAWVFGALFTLLCWGYGQLLHRRHERVIRQFHDEARLDALTGLPNRLWFRERLGVALERAEREGEPLALLFLDLNRFKLVNDSLGHAVGDELLRLVAEKLAGSVRTGDTVARLGGDEFVLLLPGIGGERQAREVAERVTAALREPLRVEQHQLSVSASIGLSLFPADGVSADDLLKTADLAMYQDKFGARAQDKNPVEA